MYIQRPVKTVIVKSVKTFHGADSKYVGLLLRTQNKVCMHI